MKEGGKYLKLKGFLQQEVFQNSVAFLKVLKLPKTQEYLKSREFLESKKLPEREIFKPFRNVPGFLELLQSKEFQEFVQSKEYEGFLDEVRFQDMTNLLKSKEKLQEFLRKNKRPPELIETWELLQSRYKQMETIVQWLKWPLSQPFLKLTGFVLSPLFPNLPLFLRFLQSQTFLEYLKSQGSQESKKTDEISSFKELRELPDVKKFLELRKSRDVKDFIRINQKLLDNELVVKGFFQNFESLNLKKIQELESKDHDVEELNYYKRVCKEIRDFLGLYLSEQIKCFLKLENSSAVKSFLKSESENAQRNKDYKNPNEGESRPNSSRFWQVVGGTVLVGGAAFFGYQYLVRSNYPKDAVKSVITTSAGLLTSVLERLGLLAEKAKDYVGMSR